MQTILGASGIIGTELAKALPAYTSSIRLVSRSPKKVNETDDLFAADLLDAQQTEEAVRGSEIVYLTAGLVYKTSVWREQWPAVMRNVIDACKKQGAKLVFFDNIYMYGPVSGIMTEETPFNPTSEKGKIRAGIATMLLDEVKSGNLTAMICRAPEFYGPGKTMSVVNAMVFDNIRKDKKAQWLITDKSKRTFIYTPDAGKATALLANSTNTWNQTWHLPGENSFPTGKEFMQLISEVAGKEIKYTVLSRFMINFAGLFVSPIREIKELLYQFEQDYIFSSDKFRKAFPDFKITHYKEGIAAILNR
jgi:nucleoside-diphosphate-sugar epimerase